MTRILYLSTGRFPSERAHSRQAAEMCAAFAEAGASVTLAHPDLPPRGSVPAGADLFAYYDLPRTFREAPLPSLGLPELFGEEPDLRSRLWRTIAHGSAALSGLARLAREAPGEGLLLYSREKHATYLARRLPRRGGLGLLLEVHDLARPLDGPNRRLLESADGIVVIHPALRDDLVEEGLAPEGILVEPDGVREAPASPLSREAARRALGEETAGRRVVYTGHLYPSKGVDVLVRAMEEVPAAEAVVVGGTGGDLARLRALLGDRTDVRVVGHVDPARARLHQAAADVLVLPTRPLDENARRYTSPLKLAEYRAAVRPIVASDVPSLRAWLVHGETAWLVPPDDPGALAAGIRRLLDDPALAGRLAARAREGLERETWRARAERILAFAEARGAISRRGGSGGGSLAGAPRGRRDRGPRRR